MTGDTAFFFKMSRQCDSTLTDEKHEQNPSDGHHTHCDHRQCDNAVW